MFNLSNEAIKMLNFVSSIEGVSVSDIVNDSIYKDISNRYLLYDEALNSGYDLFEVRKIMKSRETLCKTLTDNIYTATPEAIANYTNSEQQQISRSTDVNGGNNETIYRENTCFDLSEEELHNRGCIVADLYDGIIGDYKVYVKDIINKNSEYWNKNGLFNDDYLYVMIYDLDNNMFVGDYKRRLIFDGYISLTYKDFGFCYEFGQGKFLISFIKHNFSKNLIVGHDEFYIIHSERSSSMSVPDSIVAYNRSEEKRYATLFIDPVRNEIIAGTNAHIIRFISDKKAIQLSREEFKDVCGYCKKNNLKMIKIKFKEL